VPTSGPEVPQPKGGCPDFDLAPFVEYSPHVFSQTHNDTDAFILAMALAFNDMKGLHWVFRQLNKCKPETTSKNPEVGQWAGMGLQFSRLSMLVLHELLKAIVTAKQAEVFDDEHFSKAVERLDQTSRHDWSELVALASETPSGDPVREYIMRVRDNFSAHYYQPKALLRGYRKVFFEEQRTEFNEHALASFGDEVEATRFYFADAAAQRGQQLLDPRDAFVQQVDVYIIRMFQVLRFLVQAYLDLKSETTTAENLG
jgi:hypothetical protein